jgi:hypothetical protein
VSDDPDDRTSTFIQQHGGEQRREEGARQHAHLDVLVARGAGAEGELTDEQGDGGAAPPAALRGAEARARHGMLLTWR